MSMHTKPLTAVEEEGLRLHGLAIGTPSQLSDAFRQGIAWAHRSALAAPRQPEGDAISRERVQAEADAFFDWPTADKSSVTTTSCLIFARCIAGMVAAERDATIAELRDSLADPDAVLVNMMRGTIARPSVRAFSKLLGDVINDEDARLLEIAELREECERLQYAADHNSECVRILQAERDTLRQQLADRDATIERLEAGIPRIQEQSHQVRQQRDKLAGLLRKAYGVDDPALLDKINAALAEVNK